MRRGFTLIEVLVAGAVLSIGCLGLLAMLTTSLSQRTVSRDRTQATLLAEGFLVQMARDARTWTPTVNPPAGTHLRTVQTMPVGAWQRLGAAADLYNVNGIVPPPGTLPAGRFHVGVFRRQQTPGLPAPADPITGAIRVAWAKNPGVICDVGADFDDFDTTAFRNNENVQGCDFITLPFTFSPN